METPDFLLGGRGKITGPNVISVRFDILQMQPDYRVFIVKKVTAGGYSLPLKKLHARGVLY